MPPAPALAAMAAPTEDTLLRLAALLGLDGAQHTVLLTAAFTAAALPLAERYDTVVAVMGATGPSPVGVGYVSGSADAVPFADATFHGAALDAATSPALAADVVRCVRMGGRIVGDAALAVPAGVQELARDREQWVGEVEAPAIVVPLRRA